MNFFQEYEQAKANPLTVKLYDVINYYEYDDDEIESRFSDIIQNVYVPSSKILKNMIHHNDLVIIYDVVRCFYEDDYYNYFLDFANETIKKILHLIPEDYQKYYQTTYNFVTPYINHSIIIENNVFALFTYYAVKCLESYNRFRNKANTLFSIISDISNMMYYFCKIYNKSFEIVNACMIDAFIFMCDYRFVPDSYKQMNW